MYRFEVLRGPGTGSVFPLKAESVVIGRGISADIQLDTQWASRHHAVVTFKGGRPFLHNVSQPHETYVNERVATRDVAHPEPIIPGDIVRISDVELKLEYEKDEPLVPPVPPPTPWTLEKQIRAATLPFDNAPPQRAPVVQSAPRVKPATEERLIEIESLPPPVAPPAPSAPAIAPPLAATESVGPARSAIDDFDDTSAGLPRVWFAIDVSGSMAGEPIRALKRGLAALADAPADALPEFMLTLITFGTGVRGDYPPVRRTAFRLPELNVEGFSALAAALNTLRERLTRAPQSAPPPLVFVLTDGGGTDDPKGKSLTPPSAELCRFCVGIYGKRDVPPALFQGAEAAVRASNPANFPALFDWIRAVLRAEKNALPPVPQALTSIRNS
jgi:uncharacterized protein YegL